MGHERIDFISAYCDGWCERCAFTSRCSAYAVRIATAMCGDFREGLELAVGRPRAAHEKDTPSDSAVWQERLEELESFPEPDPEDECREQERTARLSADPIERLSKSIAVSACQWLANQGQELHASVDPLVREAIDVAQHDAVLISAKLHRALAGRDTFRVDGLGEDDAVQNDWNGSAKVALISLERSTDAWRTLAHTTRDLTPATIADQLGNLTRLVETTFPDARRFIRPGFDEPGR